MKVMCNNTKYSDI